VNSPVASTHSETDLTSLTAGFVNRTNRHVFLTGKAGTGKTTFLRHLAETTHKRFVIVAPTGIAALNAKGVTIHSQFLLPPGTFLPEAHASGSIPDNQYLITPSTLARKHPMNAARRQVLRDIDLLIIDEVSMLRADLLDAIDYRLRSVRRNFRQRFGGVQLLMIGDLYQLPPVVKEAEWSYLKNYYSSAHFFESQALREAGFVYVELDKIYRQSDDTFIHLLNNLRNNCPTRADIDLLNSKYLSDEGIGQLEEVITLTTHNYRAEELNTRALNQLEGRAQVFNAAIEGDFPESMYPVSASITLKKDAQVMFVKNDPQGRYFNGKLARVVSLNAASDIIEVELAGDHTRLTLERESWENKRYTVNARTKELDENVIGTFEQFPIKLAWAITVHKSQGLTFDRAVIDVGNAFAPGQVYVALSRLRSLDGLILRTRIDPEVIATDAQVLHFTSQQPDTSGLPNLLQSAQAGFLRDLLHQAFDFRDLIHEADLLLRNHPDHGGFAAEDMKPATEQIKRAFAHEVENLARFRTQLESLLVHGPREGLLDRIVKGSAYYDNLLREQLKSLLTHTELVRRRSRTKTYVSELEEFDLLITRKRDQIGRSAYLAESVLEDREIVRTEVESPARQRDRASLLEYAREIASALPENTGGKTVKKAKKVTKKKSTVSTFEETFKLLQSGLTIEEIASRRSLTTSTIETHLTRFVQAGTVDVRKLMTDEVLSEIIHLLQSSEGRGLKTVYARAGGKFSYQQLKMVEAHLQHNEE